MTAKERIIKLNLSGNIEKAFLLLVDELGGSGQSNDLSAFLDELEDNAKLSADGKAVRYGDVELRSDNGDMHFQVTKPLDGVKQWANLGIINQRNNKNLVQAYIELFGDSSANWNENPIPNAIIGKCTGGVKKAPLNLPVMSFCAIEDDINYTKVNDLKRVLFKFTNGYVDNESILELYGEVLKVLTDIQLNGQIIDNLGNTGNDGDVLTKENGKVVWKSK